MGSRGIGRILFRVLEVCTRPGQVAGVIDRTRAGEIGSFGRLSNPRDWAPFEEVRALLLRRPRLYNGPGFVFSMSDLFAGIDLDECLDPEGSVKPWGQGIVERFSDCYTEISPGGSGLKIGRVAHCARSCRA